MSLEPVEKQDCVAESRQEPLSAFRNQDIQHLIVPLEAIEWG